MNQNQTNQVNQINQLNQANQNWRYTDETLPLFVGVALIPPHINNEKTRWVPSIYAWNGTGRRLVA